MNTPAFDALYGGFMQHAPKISEALVDRQKDLNNLILEAQGCLLLHAHSELGKHYNNKLRKIISTIQDLRDELSEKSK